MGALVPFPTVKAQGRPAGPNVRPDSPAEVIILPVVQYVRPAAKAVTSAACEPR